MSLRTPGFANLDALRPETGRSPLHQTRQYNPGEGVTTQAPRQDLKFNLDSLRPFQQVPQGLLQYIADTMRYCDFGHIPFSVGTVASDAPVLTKPSNKRTFLLIQNTHATQDLFIGFGIKPSSAIGVKIAAGGSLLLDAVVAQNDVYLAGSGAATTGLLTYANQEFGQL